MSCLKYTFQICFYLFGLSAFVLLSFLISRIWNLCVKLLKSEIIWKKKRACGDSDPRPLDRLTSSTSLRRKSAKVYQCSTWLSYRPQLLSNFFPPKLLLEWDYFLKLLFSSCYFQRYYSFLLFSLSFQRTQATSSY